MNDVNWTELRRLSSNAAEAGRALDDFLAKCPAPRTSEELAAYDRVRDAADDAFHAWSAYCSAKR